MRGHSRILVGCAVFTAALLVAPGSSLLTEDVLANQREGEPQIFDVSRIHQVELTMEPGDWAALRANYLLNTIYKADVRLDGVVVSAIGVRSRGAGSRSGTKPGLRLDLNENVKGQRYAGYTDLVLDNFVQDRSFVREKLAFTVFEAMGIPAPRSAYARLTVNGRPWGLYAIVEPIGERFLEDRFGDKRGTLYDFTCHSDDCYNLEYLGDDPKLYVPDIFDPKENSSADSDRQLVDFVRGANDVSDEKFLGVVSGYLDVPKFLTYLAVENAVAHADGFLGTWNMNNFYLYRHGETSKFVLLPWDMDNAFRAADHPLFSRVDQNVLSRRLLAIPSQRASYRSAVEKAISFVNPRWLGPRLDALIALIQPEVYADTRKPRSNAYFDEQIAELKRMLAEREQSVLTQLKTNAGGGRANTRPQPRK